MIVVGARFFIVVPTVPLVQSDFVIQPPVAQLIISAPYFFTLISLVIAGFIIRKFRTHQVISFVLTVSVPGSLLCLFAPTFMILLIGRVWQSLTLGVLIVATRLLISEHSDSDKTIQKLMELFSVGILATAAVAPTVGAVLTVSYGWRSVHALILLLTVITCMLAWSYRSDSEKYQAQEYSYQVGREPSKRICWDRTYLAYMIQSSFHFAMAVTFVSFLPHHVITQRGESYGSLGIGASLLVIGVGVGVLIANRLLGRLRRARQNMIGSVIATSFCFGAAFYAYSSTEALTIWEFIAWGMAVAIGVGVSIPSAQLGLLSTIRGNHLGVSLSVYDSLRLILAGIGSQIAGLMSQSSAYEFAVFLLLISLVGLAASACLPRPPSTG